MKSFERGAIGGASIEIPGAGIEAQARFGLIAGHAYSLTAALKTNTGAKLVCLRNPWGQVEWEGKWHDEDECWDEVRVKILNYCSCNPQFFSFCLISDKNDFLQPTQFGKKRRFTP